MSQVRRSFVAGRFYPGSGSECRKEIRKYAVAVEGVEIEGAPCAGIVPHAGWVFSGQTAGKVFAEIKKHGSPNVFVLFGAVHRFLGKNPVVMEEGVWSTPLGEIGIDAGVTREILGMEGVRVESGAAEHEGEHSIEVQVPFIQELFPEAKIVPVLVPPSGEAAAFGKAAGEVLNERDGVVVIGSTDLTHYGPEYGFAPKGTGEKALEWAKEVNDRKIIDAACGMRAEEIVDIAGRYSNACGSGAIAATVAAAREMGKKKGVVIEHTTSHEVMPRGEPSMFVGYAGIVF